MKEDPKKEYNSRLNGFYFKKYEPGKILILKSRFNFWYNGFLIGKIIAYVATYLIWHAYFKNENLDNNLTLPILLSVISFLILYRDLMGTFYCEIKLEPGKGMVAKGLNKFLIPWKETYTEKDLITSYEDIKVIEAVVHKFVSKKGNGTTYYTWVTYTGLDIITRWWRIRKADEESAKDDVYYLNKMFKPFNDFYYHPKN